MQVIRHDMTLLQCAIRHMISAYSLSLRCSLVSYVRFQPYPFRLVHWGHSYIIPSTSLGSNVEVYEPAYHYFDVLMSAMASQFTDLSIVYPIVCSGANKKNIKVPRHWPLWGKFTDDRWILHAENVSVWWRHHVTSRDIKNDTEHNKPCTYFVRYIVVVIRLLATTKFNQI